MQKYVTKETIMRKSVNSILKSYEMLKDVNNNLIWKYRAVEEIKTNWKIHITIDDLESVERKQEYPSRDGKKVFTETVVCFVPNKSFFNKFANCPEALI